MTGSRTHRALIVDDDVAFARSLERGMRAAGWRVKTARSVADAIDTLKGGTFDLVMLDVCLGSESGITVAEAAWQLAPAPAVIAMSGAARREDVFRLAQLGVRAFVEKTEIASRIDELMSLASRPVPLGPHVRAQVGQRSIREAVFEVREGMLEQALAESRGSIRRASKILGISRQSLQQMVARRQDEEH